MRRAGDGPGGAFSIGRPLQQLAAWSRVARDECDVPAGIGCRVADRYQLRTTTRGRYRVILIDGESPGVITEPSAR